jgi:hypothetical protein
MTDLIKREDVLYAFDELMLEVRHQFGLREDYQDNQDVEVLAARLREIIAALPAEPAPSTDIEDTLGSDNGEPEDWGHDDCEVCNEARRRKLGGWFDPNSHGRGGL